MLTTHGDYPGHKVPNVATMRPDGSELRMLTGPKPQPVTVRYVCPICGRDHARVDCPVTAGRHTAAPPRRSAG